MSGKRRIAYGTCLLGLIMLTASCVIAPREGYYDRAHHRYWHSHAWHACDVNDMHCR